MEVDVHPLGPLTDISNHSIDQDSLVPAHPMANIIRADTYIFEDDNNLIAELWSFDDFVKNKARKWHGSAADNNLDITEVDRRRNEIQRSMA